MRTVEDAMARRTLRLIWFLVSLCTPWRVAADRADGGSSGPPSSLWLVPERPGASLGAAAPAPESPLPAPAPGDLPLRFGSAVLAARPASLLAV